MPTTARVGETGWLPAATHVLGAAAFTLLATMNAAGYRYGVGDQAGHIPSILRGLDSRLFPRDSALIDAQSRLYVFDELLARAMGVVPASLEAWFLALYLLTLVLLYAGLVRLADRLLVSRWAVAAFVAVSAVRHRIAKTSANTLEGYFHPRQLAFAIGVLGLGEMMRARPWTALAAAGAAGAIHPMTGLWFVVWIGVATFVEQPRLRPALAIGGALGGAAGIGLLAAGFLPVSRMDDAWLATLAGKDYLFATDWGAVPWLLNAAYPLIIGLTYLARRRRGLVQPGEAGLVAGCLALVAAFLVTLPLVASHMAVAVQLQVSRVFWMADLLAILGAVWWLAESGLPRRGETPMTSRAAPPAHRRWTTAGRAPWVFATLLALAVGRGGYALFVEHPERPLFAVSAPADAWRDVSDYLRRATPPGTHVLADPNHAWRFGSSLRVLAARDVFLENVKDEAMSLYDRRMAQRITERRLALGDFEQRTAPELLALGRRFDLDVVISERDLALPEIYRNPQFRVYRLAP
jgi:hypothetical protein